MFRSDKPLPKLPGFMASSSSSSGSATANSNADSTATAGFAAAKTFFKAMENPLARAATKGAALEVMKTAQKDGAVPSQQRAHDAAVRGAISGVLGTKPDSVATITTKLESCRVAPVTPKPSPSHYEPKPAPLSVSTTTTTTRAAPPFSYLPASTNSSNSGFNSQYSPPKSTNSQNHTASSIYPDLKSKPQQQFSPSNSKPVDFDRRQPHAVALHRFDASHFDELSVESGDFILLKKSVDMEWFYGQNVRDGKYGIVPVGFLDIKVPLPGEHSSSSSAAFPIGTATILHDFYSGVSGDLEAPAGTSIQILAIEDTEWLRARSASDGREGLVPVSFTDWQQKPSSHQPPLQQQRQQFANSVEPNLNGGQPWQRVHLAYDFDGETADDLPGRADETLLVLEHLDASWLRASYANNPARSGLVPKTFVRECVTADQSVRTSDTHSSVLRQITARHDYNSHQDRHLIVSAGDQIDVVQEVDNYWLWGRLAGVRGLPDGLIPKMIAE